MSTVVRIKREPRLRIVKPGPTETVFGSHGFISRTRNPALMAPVRFEPTSKKEGDIVL